RHQAGEARGPARPQFATGRRRGIPRRSAITADFGTSPSAEPQPPTQKGTNTGSAAPRTGGLGAAAARGGDCRGCALDRPDLARIARPRRPAGPQSAGAADCDVSSRVPTALDQPAASDDAGPQSPESARA